MIYPWRNCLQHSELLTEEKVMKCKLMMMLFIACCEAMFRYLLRSTVGPEGKKKNAIERGIINIFGLSWIISGQKCILTSEHEVRRSLFDKFHFRGAMIEINLFIQIC